VVCDNSFTLFVNGQKVGSGKEFKNAFLFDLRPFLKAGENLFAVDGVNHLADNSQPAATNAPGSENPAGLLFYARLRSTENGRQRTNDFTSDSSWKTSSRLQANWEKPGFAADNWTPAVKLGESGMLPWRVARDYLATKLASAYPGTTRAALVASDSLLTALGRPNREQVVTTRPSVATTLQALEMTNGETLADILKRGARNLLNRPVGEAGLVPDLYGQALGRPPTKLEMQVGRELAGQPAQAAGVEDLLWTMAMLPEFQLIY
jgi:hypothetical protein